MNINLDRYWKSCSIESEPRTFLDRWHKRAWNKFYNKHEPEFTKHNKLYIEQYDLFCNKPEWKEISKALGKLDPCSVHWLEHLLISIPQKIRSWLCCGPEWRYDKDRRTWTWIENYHMMDKLCRYETCPEVKVTWWDRLRFKWITGYEFENIQ